MPALVTVELANINGLIEDSYTNSFAIPDTADGAINNAQAVLDAIAGFYNDTVGTNGPDEWLSPVISRVANAHTLRIYDLAGHLDGSAHGSPVLEDTFTIAAGDNANALPQEVAVVVTLEATGRATAAVEAPDSGDPGTAIDRPKQRRTGRIFFGPLHLGAVNTSDDQWRPSSTMLTDLRLSIAATHDELDGIANVGGLGVWSRVDEAVRALEAVSTDNVWDTQRRRGLAPTVRTRLAM